MVGYKLLTFYSKNSRRRVIASPRGWMSVYCRLLVIFLLSPPPSVTLESAGELLGPGLEAEPSSLHFSALYIIDHHTTQSLLLNDLLAASPSLNFLLILWPLYFSL